MMPTGGRQNGLIPISLSAVRLCLSRWLARPATGEGFAVDDARVLGFWAKFMRKRGMKRGTKTRGML
jgi:hypothetical protein